MINIGFKDITSASNVTLKCCALEAGVIRKMTKRKTQLEAAAGKLISAIQKEWGEELGNPAVEMSEEAMNKGHDLLAGAKNNNVHDILRGMSVTQFLGDIWVQKHPSVKQSISNFEVALNESGNV